MAEARSITNVIGNAVATVVVSNWEGALNVEKMQRVLDGQTEECAEDPIGQNLVKLVSERKPLAQ